MSTEDLSLLLRQWSNGDQSAVDRLIAVAYPQLRRSARGVLRRERPNHTVQSTELVHEAFLRLFHGAHVDVESRKTFFSLMATHMKHVLVDHARRRSAVKRGGELIREQIDDFGAVPVAVSDGEDGEAYFARLDAALQRLAQQYPRPARVVQERIFADLSIEDVASTLGVSAGTVKRDYQFARAWLARELDSGGLAPV